MALRIPPRIPPAHKQIGLANAWRYICENAPDLDPEEVKSALQEAIQHGQLTVVGVPEPYLSDWRQNPVLDWESGLLIVGRAEVPITLRPYFVPTVNLGDVITLFEGGGNEASQTPKKPVPEAQLRAYLKSLPGHSLKEVETRAKVDQHFAGKSIPEQQWRAVWKTFERKRKPGETDRTIAARKSDT